MTTLPVLGKGEPEAFDTPGDDSRIVPEVAKRLALAVKAAGGSAAVARQSGVPLRTLGNYLEGGGIKFEPLMALAATCGVSLDWLATGRGPMTPGETTAAAPPPAQPAPSCPRFLKAFGSIDVDVLTECLEAVLRLLRETGIEKRDWRRIVQASLLLYDELLAARAMENKEANKGEQSG